MSPTTGSSSRPSSERPREAEEEEVDGEQEEEGEGERARGREEDATQPDGLRRGKASSRNFLEHLAFKRNLKRSQAHGFRNVELRFKSHSFLPKLPRASSVQETP